MKHCYLKRNLKFFTGCMCAWAMFAPMTAQVLPDGITRLTPEGLELGSVMSVANPLGPKEHAVRTEVLPTTACWTRFLPARMLIMAASCGTQT